MTMNALPSFELVCSCFVGIVSVSFFLFIINHLFKKRSRYPVSGTIQVNTGQYDENIIRASDGLELQSVTDGCNKAVLNWEVAEFFDVDKGSKVLSQRSLVHTVFILLDDVEQVNRLDAIAANLDSYAPGSSIIFVRRGKGVMGAPQVKESCAVRRMQFHNTFVLSCIGAFRRDPAAADYVGLFMTPTTRRLPLVLGLVDSFLFGEKKLIWRNILKKFKAISHQDIKDQLRMSQGTLDCDEKQIFHELACFFLGTDKRIAFHMWEGCNFFPKDGTSVLLAMSLVKFRHQNELWKHDKLVSLLGEEIVLHRNYNELVTKCMVCFTEEAVDVHGSCMIQGTTELEATRTDGGTPLEGNSLRSQELLSELESNTIDGWNGWSSLQMAHRLKSLTLMSCRKLKETPKFSWFPLLEKLRIEHCKILEFVDPSIGSLQNLNFLSVKHCSKLKVLPQELASLKALTKLCIDGTCVKELPPLNGLKMLVTLSSRKCRSLTQIPSIGHLTSLVELQLDYSGVCQFPDSIGELQNLQVLNASSCKYLDGESFQDLWRLYSLRTLILSNTNIKSLPASLSKLSHLQTLDLAGCHMLHALPELPKSLQKLLVTSKLIVTLPNFSNLVNLEELQLIRCENLVELPSDISKLSKLKKLSLTHLKISVLPEEISTLSHLQELAIINCEYLKYIPKLPMSLDKLEMEGISATKVPDLSSSTNLSELKLSDCSKLEEIPGLGSLTSLRILTVIESTELTELDGLEKLESLRELHMSKCDSLENLPDISKLRQLHHCVVHQCKSLQSLPSLSGLKELRYLDLSYCKKLQVLEGLEDLESLQTLDISGCKEIEILPNLSKLQNLEDLLVQGCDKLREIRGLEELGSKLSIHTHGCTSLQSISDLRNIKVQG